MKTQLEQLISALGSSPTAVQRVDATSADIHGVEAPQVGELAAQGEGVALQVKWPNDVWIERRKCAGILVESRTIGMRIDSVIIGVGLNVNRTQWPTELANTATSLRAEQDGGEPFNRADVLAAVLSHIERWVERLSRDGAAVVVNALRPNLALVGESVRWEDGEGIFDGIDPSGAARVRTDAGVLSLHAAHIEPVER